MSEHPVRDAGGVRDSSNRRSLVPLFGEMFERRFADPYPWGDALDTRRRLFDDAPGGVVTVHRDQRCPP
jgi:hypothetical protein